MFPVRTIFRAGERRWIGVATDIRVRMGKTAITHLTVTHIFIPRYLENNINKSEAMTTSLDIGNFFIDMAIRTGIDDLTNLKLNKLVYYAQALALVKLNRPLFNEDIEAWVYGPVIPTIYHTFKIYGKNPIRETKGNYSIDNIPSDELEVLSDVYLRYGNYEPTELMWTTHEKGTPWQINYHEGERNIVIPQQEMREYYLSHQDEFNPHDINTDSIKRTGYRDSEGVLVLPADMDCPEDDIFDQMCAKGA